MQTKTKVLAVSVTSLCFAAVANAQTWVNFQDQTAARMPLSDNTASLSTTDNQEKDYAWGDVNRDGWTDLVNVRKIPFTFEGGRVNVLWLNDGGVLKDRTSTYVNSSINTPNASNGFADNTNDRDVVLVDLNNDGWLDMVTATTLSDGLTRQIGHPRVYMNQGESGGVWQGFVYDFNRIPQLISKQGNAANPRFCSVSAGDLDLDGYADLYFGDYDNGEVGPAMVVAWDMDNKLLMNLGAANPAFFVDEGNSRMGATLLFNTFGAASIIADMNNDGLKDVVKQTSLQNPIQVYVKTNLANDPGEFSNMKSVYALTAYFVSAGDLNNDGRLDLVFADDGRDRYMLQNGTLDANQAPNFNPNVQLNSNINNESFFNGNIVIADLDNDGWKDVLVADVDVDTPTCADSSTFRMRIFHNHGNPPNVTLLELNPSPIATSLLQDVHDMGVFDLDNDGWLDMVLGRCTGTQVYMNVPMPSLAMSYPGGKPSVLVPGESTTFQVQVSGTNGGLPLAGSGRQFVSIDGGVFVESVMTHLGGNLYEATIPAVPCGSSVRYYFRAEVGGSNVFDPKSQYVGGTSPASFYSAESRDSETVLLSEDFEGAVSGWTVSNTALVTGAWEVAVPNGTWNEGVQSAPFADNSPGGTKAFVTQNGAPGGAVGAADVKGGPTQLLSPTIDLTNSNARIEFAYWYYSSTHMNVLDVHVSNNNGANWTLVKRLTGPKLAEPNFTPAEPNSWKDFSFVVSDFVEPTNQIKVRFSASDALPAGHVEAAIDDFVVNKHVCGGGKGPECPADISGDDTVGVPDLLAVINAWGPCPGCPADIAPIGGDDTVGVPDLLAVINAWGACPQ